MTWEVALLMLPGLIVGITVHEFAHAFSASLLGDRFARRQGRVSLNPMRHLSPLGTLAIFVLPFGWGRPVPVNLYNFRRPRRDYLLTSLAGPAANVLVVALCLALMQLTRHPYGYGQLPAASLIVAHHLLILIAFINLVLAVINLLPIPPLDGSKIWPCLIPQLKPSFGKKTTGLFLIVLLVLLWTNSLSWIIDFALDGLKRYMPASDETFFSDRFDNGREAYQRENYAQAEKHLTDALAIDPHSHQAFCWRSQARLAQGKLHEAAEDIDRAITLAPYRSEYEEYRDAILRAIAEEELQTQPSDEPASDEPTGTESL